VEKIKQKRSLLLLSTFGLVALIAILPSTLAFSGTVLPREINNTYGTQTGTLYDIKYEDDVVVKWTGVTDGYPIHKIKTKVYFVTKLDVGDGNELEMEFSFTGGNVLDVKIVYTDDTYDLYNEYRTSTKTVIYDLEDNKIVDYVQFYNLEWWHGGVLKVDYMEVNY
jgi:hypothetical protein